MFDTSCFAFSAFYLRRSNQIWYALTFCTSNNHFRNSIHLLTNTWRELRKRFEFLRESHYEMVNTTKFSNEECLLLSWYTDVQYQLLSWINFIFLNVNIIKLYYKNLKNDFLVVSVQINSHKCTEMCQTKCAFKRTIWRYPLQWPFVENRLLCDDQILHIKKSGNKKNRRPYTTLCKKPYLIISINIKFIQHQFW